MAKPVRTAPAPTPDAARVRRHRERRRAGLAVAPVEIDHYACARWLLSLEYLKLHQLDDIDAIADALARYIAMRVEGEFM